MLETVKKPQLPPDQPLKLRSVGRIVQASVAGFALLYLLGYGFAGQVLLSRSPANSAASNMTDTTETDDALMAVP
ncbi:MAG TPA: hypothetical protein V6C63_18705 [Allocoleopsis sp.]